MASVNKMLAKARKALKHAETALKREQAELDKAIKKDAIVHWMAWHTVSYAYAKILVNRWTAIVKAIEMAKADALDAEDVGQRLKGWREALIEQVMRRQAANKSTGQVTNILADVEADVCRRVAGLNTLDDDSLWMVLYDGGIKI